MQSRYSITFRVIAILILGSFLFNNVFGSTGYAQIAPAMLPVPGTMLTPTAAFNPTIVTGLNLYPDNPLKFDFIIDRGDVGAALAVPAGRQVPARDGMDNNNGPRQARPLQDFEKTSERLIKYFLASLTTPQDEMWVNLSPNEPDRIIPDGFGNTEMGRDLLAQDYLLKQLTSSLMHPESELGEKFWDGVYEKLNDTRHMTHDTRTGTLHVPNMDIPNNLMGKIWIVPETAKLYEHEKGVFIVDTHLKVMMESDYFDGIGHRAEGTEKQKNQPPRSMLHANKIEQNISSDLIREIIIPEIEREVNEGEIFANLRQIYNSMILAMWYKQRLKDAVLDARSLILDTGSTQHPASSIQDPGSRIQHPLQSYIDAHKADGVDIASSSSINGSPIESGMTSTLDVDAIYNQYLSAFEQGVYDLIKEEYDPVAQEIIPRKYFSGGVDAAAMSVEIEHGREAAFDAAAMAQDPQKVTIEVEPSDDEVSLDFEGMLQRIREIEGQINHSSKIRLSSLINELEGIKASLDQFVLLFLRTTSSMSSDEVQEKMQENGERAGEISEEISELQEKMQRKIDEKTSVIKIGDQFFVDEINRGLMSKIKAFLANNENALIRIRTDLAGTIIIKDISRFEKFRLDSKKGVLTLIDVLVTEVGQIISMDALKINLGDADFDIESLGTLKSIEVLSADQAMIGSDMVKSGVGYFQKKEIRKYLQKVNPDVEASRIEKFVNDAWEDSEDPNRFKSLLRLVRGAKKKKYEMPLLNLFSFSVLENADELKLRALHEFAFTIYSKQEIEEGSYAAGDRALPPDGLKDGGKDVPLWNLVDTDILSEISASKVNVLSKLMVGGVNTQHRVIEISNANTKYKNKSVWNILLKGLFSEQALLNFDLDALGEISTKLNRVTIMPDIGVGAAKRFVDNLAEALPNNVLIRDLASSIADAAMSAEAEVTIIKKEDVEPENPFLSLNHEGQAFFFSNDLVLVLFYAPTAFSEGRSVPHASLFIKNSEEARWIDDSEYQHLETMLIREVQDKWEMMDIAEEQKAFQVLFHIILNEIGLLENYPELRSQVIQDFIEQLNLFFRVHDEEAEWYIRALNFLEVKSEEYITALIRLSANTKKSNIVDLISKTLLGLAEQAAPVLNEIVKNQENPQELRNRAIRVLGEMYKGREVKEAALQMGAGDEYFVPTEETIQTFRESLKEDELVLEAVIALGNTGELAKKAADDLTDLLGDASRQLSDTILIALQKIQGSDTTAAISTIVDDKKDKDLRRDAVIKLNEILLSDVDENGITNIEISDVDNLAEALMLLMNDYSGQFINRRVTMLKTLALLGPKVKGILPALKGMDSLAGSEKYKKSLKRAIESIDGAMISVVGDPEISFVKVNQAEVIVFAKVDEKSEVLKIRYAGDLEDLNNFKFEMFILPDISDGEAKKDREVSIGFCNFIAGENGDFEGFETKITSQFTRNYPWVQEILRQLLSSDTFDSSFSELVEYIRALTTGEVELQKELRLFERLLAGLRQFSDEEIESLVNVLQDLYEPSTLNNETIELATSVWTGEDAHSDIRFLKKLFLERVIHVNKVRIEDSVDIEDDEELFSEARKTVDHLMPLVGDGTVLLNELKVIIRGSFMSNDIGRITYGLFLRLYSKIVNDKEAVKGFLEECISANDDGVRGYYLQDIDKIIPEMFDSDDVWLEEQIMQNQEKIASGMKRIVEIAARIKSVFLRYKDLYESQQEFAESLELSELLRDLKSSHEEFKDGTEGNIWVAVVIELLEDVFESVEIDDSALERALDIVISFGNTDAASLAPQKTNIVFVISEEERDEYQAIVGELPANVTAEIVTNVDDARKLLSGKTADGLIISEERYGDLVADIKVLTGGNSKSIVVMAEAPGSIPLHHAGVSASLSTGEGWQKRVKEQVAVIVKKVEKQIGDAAMITESREVKILFADAPGAGLDTIAAVKSELEALQASLPEGTKLTVLDDYYDVGVKGDPKPLEEAIKAEKPDIVMVRSKTNNAFTDPEFVRMAKANNVRAIIRMGAGTDNINSEVSAEEDISVIRTHGNANSVADLTLFQIAALSQVSGFPVADEIEIEDGASKWAEISQTTTGEYGELIEKSKKWNKNADQDAKDELYAYWQRRYLGPLEGNELTLLASVLKGKTVALWGWGAIPKIVAEKLQQVKEVTGVEFTVLAYSRSLKPGDELAKKLGVEPVSEEELFERAEILSLHLPSAKGVNPLHVELLVSESLSAVINTARSVHVAADIVEALAKGGVAYFGDFDLTDELFDLMTNGEYYDVFVFPHIAASTKDASAGVEARTLTSIKQTIQHLFGVEVEAPDGVGLDVVNGVTPTLADAAMMIFYGDRTEKVVAFFTRAKGKAIAYLQSLEKDLADSEMIKYDVNKFWKAADWKTKRAFLKLVSRARKEGWEESLVNVLKNDVFSKIASDASSADAFRQMEARFKLESLYYLANRYYLQKKMTKIPSGFTSALVRSVSMEDLNSEPFSSVFYNVFNIEVLKTASSSKVFAFINLFEVVLKLLHEIHDDVEQDELDRRKIAWDEVFEQLFDLQYLFVSEADTLKAIADILKKFVEEGRVDASEAQNFIYEMDHVNEQESSSEDGTDSWHVDDGDHGSVFNFLDDQDGSDEDFDNLNRLIDEMEAALDELAASGIESAEVRSIVATMEVDLEILRLEREPTSVDVEFDDLDPVFDLDDEAEKLSPLRNQVLDFVARWKKAGKKRKGSTC